MAKKGETKAAKAAAEAAKASETVTKTAAPEALVAASRRSVPPVVGIAECGLAELKKIVDATNSTGYLYTAPEIHNPLIEAGLVEIAVNMVNEAGEYATRATDKGRITVMRQNENVSRGETQTAGAVAEAPKFELCAGVAIPEKAKRVAPTGGGRTSIYPFDKMEVGHFFHIPATAECPNPAKAKASAVSAANERYSTPVFEEDGVTPKLKTYKVKGETRTKQATAPTRVFEIREFEYNGVKGAGVWRTK